MFKQIICFICCLFFMFSNANIVLGMPKDDAINELRKKGVNVDNTMMFNNYFLGMVITGDESTARLCIDAGVDVNFKEQIYGNTCV